MSIQQDHRVRAWLESTSTFPPEDFLRSFGVRKAGDGFCYAAWNLFHQRGGRRFSKLDVREAIRNGTVSTGPVEREKVDRHPLGGFSGEE